MKQINVTEAEEKPKAKWMAHSFVWLKRLSQSHFAHTNIAFGNICQPTHCHANRRANRFEIWNQMVFRFRRATTTALHVARLYSSYSSFIVWYLLLCLLLLWSWTFQFYAPICYGGISRMIFGLVCHRNLYPIFATMSLSDRNCIGKH